MTEKSQRLVALHGALVADAATMGMHWIYDQEHIKKIETSGDILFRQPDANLYKDVKSFFAHGAKQVGEFSQYGESARVTARVIDQQGQYEVRKHQQLFFDTFGPCGTYSGYADRPTKALIARMITDADDIPEASGSDDDQMPALCSVPALFASEASTDQISAAVAVTNVHPLATNGAQILNDCLTRLHRGETLGEALSNAVAIAVPELAELMKEALEPQEYQPLETAQRFGMACHMPQGLPTAWHLLKHAESFEGVVRDNIRCGGDNCGRSMMVGSIAGLVFGVPDHLARQVDRLT